MSSKEYFQNYFNTLKGRACRMYTSMSTRVKNRESYKDVKLNISRQEFYKWIIPELERWEQTRGLERGQNAPTVDRIVNEGHYEIGNLQLLTAKENTAKQTRYKNVNAPEGYAWCSKCKDYLLKKLFYSDKKEFNRLRNKCKSCEKVNYAERFAQRESDLDYN